MSRSSRAFLAATRSLSITCCAALLLACGGCALLPLATLSTLSGIASSAATTGPEVYDMGKLDTAFMADYDQCRVAVAGAAGDLRLHVIRDREESIHTQKWEFVLQDDRKSKVEVFVQSRAPRLCLCRVDVGVFGSEPVAKLIMHRIEAHLPASATADSTRPSNQ